MKFNKKIRIFALITLVLITLFAITASATEAQAPEGNNSESVEKLDQNMHGGDMSFSERFEYALQGTATGMLMIFAVLGLLWGIVSLSKLFFYDIPNKKKEAEERAKKAATPVAEADASSVTDAAPEPVAIPAAEDDGELAAVITAAIAAMIESGDYKNEFVGGFRVVSFKRTTPGAWNRK